MATKLLTAVTHDDDGSVTTASMSGRSVAAVTGAAGSMENDVTETTAGDDANGDTYPWVVNKEEGSCEYVWDLERQMGKSQNVLIAQYSVVTCHINSFAHARVMYIRIRCPYFVQFCHGQLEP